MPTEILNVKKELEALDHKLLDMLVKRFELSSYLADAKYALAEGGKVHISDSEKRLKLVDYYREASLKKANEKGIINPEEFSKFVTRIAEEMLLFSWELQKEYLEKKYNLSCD
ncbi:MAG: hypothetical protein VX028_01870 [Nanoarchaeota archaeon]|nr:hypothetical protein [Nanoarchaeota archaeon]MEC8339051.1 hypothetical protein [Nanoarchaeota archaeon]